MWFWILSPSSGQHVRQRLWKGENLQQFRWYSIPEWVRIWTLGKLDSKVDSREFDGDYWIVGLLFVCNVDGTPFHTFFLSRKVLMWNRHSDMTDL
jgi:hypothetical protein